MGQCMSGTTDATHDMRGNMMRERKSGQGADVLDVYEKVRWKINRSNIVL